MDVSNGPSGCLEDFSETQFNYLKGKITHAHIILHPVPHFSNGGDSQDLARPNSELESMQGGPVGGRGLGPSSSGFPGT